MWRSVGYNLVGLVQNRLSEPLEVLVQRGPILSWTSLFTVWLVLLGKTGVAHLLVCARTSAARFAVSLLARHSAYDRCSRFVRMVTADAWEHLPFDG